MNILIPIVIFASLIGGNFAITFNLDATTLVAKYFGITLPNQPDTTKIADFLFNYIAFRYKVVDWRLNPTTFSRTYTGLYYITTVKLTNTGHEPSDIVKKAEPTMEHLELNHKLFTFNGVDVCPSTGFAYKPTGTSAMNCALGAALGKLLSLGNNVDIKKGLPNLATKKATAQVAVCIVRGYYYGKDMGDFLMVGAYVD